MKSKFTPGPWRVERLDTIVSDTQRTEYASSKTIAVTWDAHESSQSNARLMAAAPEMLVALEATLTNDRVMNALPGAHRRLIMDAVAKAKGEA